MEPISQSITVLKTVKLNLWSTVSRVRGFKGFTQLLIRTKLALNWCWAKSMKSMPFLRFFAWFWGRATSKMASYGLQRQETNLKTVFAQPLVPVGLARNNVLHIELDNSNE